MEKTLDTAVKGRDEAIAARDEAQKREEDLRASFASRETLFKEQLFSIAKALLGTFAYGYCYPSLLLMFLPVALMFLSMCGFMYRCWRFEL